MAATHGRSAARLNGEPECEFATRVWFVEQISGGPHRGNRSEKVAEQLPSRDRAAGDVPVIDQSAFATRRTLQQHLTHYWRQMRALAALITQAHTTRLPNAAPKSTRATGESDLRPSDVVCNSFGAEGPASAHRGGRRMRPTPNPRLSEGEGMPDTTRSVWALSFSADAPTAAPADPLNSERGRRRPPVDPASLAKGSAHVLDLAPPRPNRRPRTADPLPHQRCL